MGWRGRASRMAAAELAEAGDEGAEEEERAPIPSPCCCGEPEQEQEPEEKDGSKGATKGCKEGSNRSRRSRVSIAAEPQRPRCLLSPLCDALSAAWTSPSQSSSISPTASTSAALATPSEVSDWASSRQSSPRRCAVCVGTSSGALASTSAAAAAFATIKPPSCGSLSRTIGELGVRLGGTGRAIAACDCFLIGPDPLLFYGGGDGWYNGEVSRFILGICLCAINPRPWGRLFRDSVY